MKVPESDLLSEDEMDGKAKDRTLLFNVANHRVYSDGKGYIELKLDPIIAPYISNFKSKFTGRFLLSALRLPDTNANRNYLLSPLNLNGWSDDDFTIKDATAN